MPSRTVINRTLSLIVAAVYLISASQVDDEGKSLVSMLLSLVFPLACIWFGNYLGQFIGHMNGRYVSKPTPGIFVSFGGWVILIGIPIMVILLGSGLN